MDVDKFFEYLEQYQLWMERHPDTVKKRREKSKVLIYDMMRYKSSEIEKMTRSEIYDLFQLKGAFSVANHSRYNMNRITDNSAVIGKRVANLLFGKILLKSDGIISGAHGV